MRPPALDAGPFAPRDGDRDHLGEHGMEEPAEPDALATPLVADPVHPVVPVAGADQRQAVRTDGQAGLDRPGAVLEQGRRFSGEFRQVVRVVLAGTDRRALDERHRLVEDGRLAGDRDVPADDVRQP